MFHTHVYAHVYTQGDSNFGPDADDMRRELRTAHEEVADAAERGRVAERAAIHELHQLFELQAGILVFR